MKPLLMLLLLIVFAGTASQKQTVKKWQASSPIVDVTLITEHSDTYDVIIDFKRSGSECGYEEDVPISPDPASDALARQMGPDELLLMIEGKQLLSFVPTYATCGVYRSTFHVLFSGAYHIKLSRTRSKFAAVNEFNLDHPLITLEYLVSDWVMLEGRKAKSAVCHPTHYGAWVHKSLVPLADGSANPEATTVFDTIESALAIPVIEQNGGDLRELPIKSFVPLSSDHATRGCVMNPDLYSYEPLTGCTWSHIAPDEAAAMLVGKKLHSLGDSHTRVFGEMLNAWTCNSGKCGSASRNYSDLNAFCAPDLYQGEVLTVRNCGHHPAAHSHYSVSAYVGLLDGLTAAVEASGSGFNKSNFAWIESHPMPLRGDQFIVGYHDWRTLHRLTLFNRLADNHFGSRGYKIIHSFHDLLPFVDSFCDFAHYTSPLAHYPLFMQYFNVLKRLEADRM